MGKLSCAGKVHFVGKLNVRIGKVHAVAWGLGLICYFVLIYGLGLGEFWEGNFSHGFHGFARMGEGRIKPEPLRPKHYTFLNDYLGRL